MLTGHQKGAASEFLLAGVLGPELLKAAYRTSIALNDPSGISWFITKHVSEKSAEKSKTYRYGDREISAEAYLCALFLLYRRHVSSYFQDSESLKRLLHDVFPPQHRSRFSSAVRAVRANGIPIMFSEEVARILWRAAEIAGPAGRKAGIADFVSSLAQNPAVVEKLKVQYGLALKQQLQSFEKAILPLVFKGFFVCLPEGTFPPPFELQIENAIGGQFRITVVNGMGDDDRLVKAAKIFVNDVLVVSQDWTQSDQAKIEAVLDLNKRNTLDVRLQGEHGTGIRVTIAEENAASSLQPKNAPSET